MKTEHPIEVTVTVPAGVDIQKVFAAIQRVEEEAFAVGELPYGHTEAISVATGIIQQIAERT